MFSANWNKKDENWMEIGDLSPGCFLYLLERLLILVFQYRGIFFAFKSSFVEWLISEQFESRPTSRNAVKTPVLEEFYETILVMVLELIYDKACTVEWIARSKINVDLYYKQMILRLVFIMCLLCVNCEKYYDDLFKVLSINDVRNQLPVELYDILQRGTENNYIQINDFVEAFQKGGDPLLVVNLGEIVPGVEYSNIISVQLRADCSREDILSLLLPVEVMSCADFPLHSSDQPKISIFTHVSDQYVLMNWKLFQEISDVLKSNGSDDSGLSASVSTIKLKEEVNVNVHFLTAAMNLCSEKKLYVSEDMMEETSNMLQELIQLHSLMNTSILEKESIEQLLKNLLSRKLKLEVFLNHFIVPKDITIALENQCADKLDVSCGEVATIDLLPPSSSSETRGGFQAERKHRGKGKGKGKSKK